MKKKATKSYSNRWGKRVLYGLCGLILLFLNSPIFIVFPMSFSSASYLAFPPPGYSLQWYQKFLQHADWIQSTWCSFQIAFIVTLLSTTLGTLGSLGFVRGRFRGKNLISAFVISPLIVPYIIIALASYFFLAKFRLVGSQVGLILIHTVIAVPIVFIIVSNTLRNFDVSLEKAAMIMGANRVRTFFKVTLPLIRTGVFSGAFFSFLTSFDELIIVLFIGGVKVVTLPRKMWEGVRHETDPTITAAATILILFSVLVLALIMIIQAVSEKRRT
ncbi:MAG: ABC transporter permease [Deltaproteobacteria bacterium]|nr:ABC transporter permease [Deltaproteobacteria bacterium]